MSFEDALTQNIIGRNVEKSYTDKILARNEIETIKQLIKKDKLTRSEIAELLYCCTSAESKLVNYDSWDRYIANKYFVWIRHISMIAEILFGYEELLVKKQKDNPEIKIVNERTFTLLDHSKIMIEQITKFNVDLYLNLARTTLSVGGHGFFDILNNRYEIHYPEMAQQQMQQKQGLFNWGGKK